MPAATIGDQRWTHVGYSEAGDRVYSRSVVQVADDYSDMTKEELQVLLEERGLPKSGTKAELIERLQESE